MGDYWTVSSGVANHTGHTCRECRGTIYVNMPIYVRDGRKIRLFYHAGCFSGDSDPRTQPQSSIVKWEGGLSSKAPAGKGYGKWWTSGYGYEGGLQNGRVLLPSSSIRQKEKSGAFTTVSGKIMRRNSSSSEVVSQGLRNGVNGRSSSSSSSDSAISGNGFERRFSLLPESLLRLEVMAKDAEDRLGKGRKQEACVEEGQSSTVHGEANNIG
ncbi:unnamed protein product [Calypogeia fissa]